MVKYLGREVEVLRDARKGDANWGTADEMVLINYMGDEIAVSKLALEDYNPQPVEHKKHKK